MAEFATTDLERLLRESRDQIAYPPTPDIAGRVLTRLQPASPERGHTLGLLATPARPQAASLPTTAHVLVKPTQPGLTSQLLKLAAAILAFVAIGGLLMAIFQLTGGDDDRLGSPASGTIVQDRLYVLTNIPDSEDKPAYGRFTAYDTATHNELYSLDVAFAAQVTLSPDGAIAYLTTDDLIAIRTSDGSLIWRVAHAGSLVGYINDGPPSLTISADGSRLITHSVRQREDGQFIGYLVRVLNAATGTTIAEFETPPDSSCSPQLQLSQSNRRVYFACWTGSRVRIADLGMARFTYDIQLPHPDSGSGQDRIAGSVQSPDGRFLYLVSDGPRINIINTGPGALEATHDLATGEPALVHRGLLALSPDGTRLAIGIQTVGHDNGLHDVGRVIVVDTTSWETIADLNLDPALPDPPMTGHSMTFNPDGTALYISDTKYEAGSVNIVDSSSVTKINITTGTREVVIEATGEHEQVWRVFSGRATVSPDKATSDDDWIPPLLLVDLNPDVPGPDKLQIRPIDPATLDDIDAALQPISAGQHWRHARSPDGKTLAAFTWPTEEPERGSLQLLDLETWQTTIAPVTNIGSVSDPFFTENGQSLYWVAGNYVEGEFVLWRYDLTSEQASIVTQFPPQFAPWELRMLSDNRLAVYGVPTDSGNLNAGDPQVIIVGLDDGSVMATVVLEGVKAGQFREDVPRIYRPGLAWDIERDLLYVVHANEDTITRVDLARGVIAETTAYTQHQSLTYRLLDWVAPTAAASPVPWTSRQAIVSEDGSKLFVAPGTSWNNWWQEDLDRFPLQILDTSNLSESRALDLPSINNMLLSPDGRFLILQTFDYDTDTNGQSIQTNQQLIGLPVDDLQQIGSISLEGVVHELHPSTEYAISGFSDDGRTLYYIQRTSTDDGPSVNLLTLDLETWTVTAERTLDNAWYSELVVPRP